jgi:hypothetical protein
MRLLVISLALIVVAAPSGASEQLVKDPSGKTIAVILDCNSCKDEKGPKCETGVVDGFHAGARCGECLLTSNFGAKLLYPFDLQIRGKLKKPDGEPLAEEFVRLYLPNTWTVRTRSTKEGLFRLLLGATEERQGERVVVELKDRVRKDEADDPDYALYMLPEKYKPCEE